MQNPIVSTYHITVEDERLGIKPEVLFKIYGAIDARARTLAPENVRHELRITQNGRIKTRFDVMVSNRMAPYLINAIQDQINDSSYSPRMYFQKLQQEIMSNLFADTKDAINY